MIRAYGLEDYEKSRTGRMFDLLFQSQRILAFGRAKIDPILEVLGGIAIAGIVGFAGWRVLSGSLDIGHVAGFITALLMLAQPVRAIGTLNTILQEAGAALARLYMLLDTPSHVSSPEQPEVLDQIKAGSVSNRSVSNMPKTSRYLILLFRWNRDKHWHWLALVVAAKAPLSI